MVHPHPARALYDRFEDHRGDVVTVRGHQAGKGHHIHFIPLAVKAALRRGGEQVIRQIALPQAVHRVLRIADRHRAEGIAVIAIAEGQETSTRLAFRLPVLQGHFHRHLNRHRTGISEENALQRFRSHCHQLAAQGHRRGVSDPAEHDVRHLVDLRFHRRIKTRVIVAVDCRPPGGHTVNQLFAAGEGQLATVGGNHRVDRQGGSHRGVGVPDVAPIEGEIVQGHK